MKKILFLLTTIIITSVSVMASITVEQSTDAEFLINSGYSQAIVEDVFMVKNRASGKPIEPLYESSQSVFTKAWRKFYSYIDPAQDTEDKLHHDIKKAPDYTDL